MRWIKIDSETLIEGIWDGIDLCHYFYIYRNIIRFVLGGEVCELKYCFSFTYLCNAYQHHPDSSQRVSHVTFIIKCLFHSLQYLQLA